ncbi:MAG: hypothetical protein PUI29_11405 [Aeromonadales bacterium]|nr:hypothetical protein [Aeromonadales bacterium]MDY2892043.1 hypothetical protein [Succinivibrio sp.]
MRFFIIWKDLGFHVSRLRLNSKLERAIALLKELQRGRFKAFECTYKFQSLEKRPGQCLLRYEAEKIDGHGVFILIFSIKA